MQTKIFLFSILALDLLVCIYGQSSAGPEPVTLPVLPTTVKTVAPGIRAGAEPEGKKEVSPLGSGSSIQMSPCPAEATPLIGDGGQPKKCLPRHSEMCGSAGACCYFNQVDYFCCAGVSSCPSFGNVTLVIYRGLSPTAGVGSPYESFFAQSQRVNVPNFDQYPGVRGPPPAYGGTPPPPPPPPAYPAPPPPPPPPAYPSPAPATSAPVGYPTPAPQPTGGYGGNVPASNNKLCPTCMGENVAPYPGQAFIPIMPESGTMHFVMPQRNAICATCGTNQVPGGGYGSVALPLPSPSYSAVPAPAVPQPSPSYGSQALPSPSPSYGGGPSPIAPQQPNVLCPTCNVNQVKPSQPNVLCPTCNQQATLPAQIGGYNVNPPPVPLQPVVSAYGANPSPTNPQPIAPQPGYGSSFTPAIPVQPNQLCPTCSIQPNVIQPGISNPQPQTPLRYDGTGNLISSGTGNLNSAGATQNNYGASRVPSSYSAPAPAQPAPSTYSAPAPAQPAPSTYSAPAPIVPIQPSPSYSAPAPSLQPASGYGQPSSNVVNPLCPTCSLQQPPPFMPFIPIQPGSNNTGMQFVMPQPGVLCPTCNVQPTVVGSYPIPGPPSPRSYGGTISNPPPVSPYGGGQQPVVPPAVAVPSYSSLPSGFVNPNLPPDQGFGVNPNVPPDQGFNAKINPPPDFPPTQKQNGTILPVLNPPTEWKPGGGFPPSKFGARRLPVLKTLPAGENPNFLDFLRRLKDSNDESSDNEENKRNRRIRSNSWR